MKRDMELVRKLLLYVEVNSEGFGPGIPRLESGDIKIPDYSNIQIAYHLKLLFDNKYVDGHDITVQESHCFECLITGLTWEGHELLDAIRDDGVWKKTQERLAPVGSVGIEVLKATAVNVAKGMLGLG